MPKCNKVNVKKKTGRLHKNYSREQAEAELRKLKNKDVKFIIREDPKFSKYKIFNINFGKFGTVQKLLVIVNTNNFTTNLAFQVPDVSVNRMVI